jgi:hypothetical protein
VVVVPRPRIPGDDAFALLGVGRLFHALNAR